MVKVDISDKQITTLKDINWEEDYNVNIEDITCLCCYRNQLTSLQYTPPNLKEFNCMCNILQPEWNNLTLEQIHTKNIQIIFQTIHKPITRNRNKIIFNTWVEYFDAPNDDDIAKYSAWAFTAGFLIQQ
jgi:hypothetical protein